MQKSLQIAIFEVARDVYQYAYASKSSTRDELRDAADALIKAYAEYRKKVSEDRACLEALSHISRLLTNESQQSVHTLQLLRDVLLLKKNFLLQKNGEKKKDLSLRELTPIQREALQILHGGEWVSSGELQLKIGISGRSVRRHMSGLIAGNLVSRYQQGNEVMYKIFNNK